MKDKQGRNEWLYEIKEVYFEKRPNTRWQLASMRVAAESVTVPFEWRVTVTEREIV